MKKFSIIFPTRERPGLLQGLLRSIEDTTSDLNSIEVIIAYDNDDELTKRSRDMWKGSRGVVGEWVTWMECERSLNFSRDYYTRGAHLSTGKYLIICNDDAEFMTPDWDIKAEASIEKYLNGRSNVFMGWIEDHLGSARLTRFGNYCCFPMIGRAGFEALGYVFPETIPTWGADIWITKLYTMIDRVHTIPMEIKHICPHNGLRESDEVHQRIVDNQVGYNVTPTRQQLVALKAVAD